MRVIVYSLIGFLEFLILTPPVVILIVQIVI